MAEASCSVISGALLISWAVRLSTSIISRVLLGVLSKIRTLRRHCIMELYCLFRSLERNRSQASGPRPLRKASIYLLTVSCLLMIIYDFSVQN